eukprot:TRINITY_DN2012_c0_g1_i1.p1 TRINITY_DN2012_c0_g1~~TRINITY_DN2012_c0_g1_i1.p1  ORF type:complete len:419 (+),score=154.59 TRINITY_DN2012_c0_g1_i1:88-1344(+)
MDAYEKIEKLGQGGQGKVYKVRRKKDKGVFVLKMINCTDQAFLKHAQIEINVMKETRHKHIVHMVDSFSYKSANHLYICIVMEYCEKGDLYQIFRKAQKGQLKPFSERTLVRWICQIASALQYLHDRDLWHRDIKSANIFFDKNNTLKLGDFGLSATYSINGHATVVGTPYYYAPEVMLRQKYTNKVDIWNLGVVILELLTLKNQPINAEVLNNRADVVGDVMRTCAQKGFSKKFGLVLCSMLSRDESNRPSAREIIQQLSDDDAFLLGQSCNSPKVRDMLRNHINSLPLFNQGTGSGGTTGTTTATHTTRPTTRPTTTAGYQPRKAVTPPPKKTTSPPPVDYTKTHKPTANLYHGPTPTHYVPTNPMPAPKPLNQNFPHMHHIPTTTHAPLQHRDPTLGLGVPPHHRFNIGTANHKP